MNADQTQSDGAPVAASVADAPAAGVASSETVATATSAETRASTDADALALSDHLIAGTQMRRAEMAAYEAARAAEVRKHNRGRISALVLAGLVESDLNATPASAADRAVKLADALLDRLERD